MLVVLCVSLTVGAQNFVHPTKSVSTEKVDSTTTYTYTMNDNTYKVYRSKGGAYYIWKTSKKTGNLYKYYLPKEIQIAMGKKYNK